MATYRIQHITTYGYEGEVTGSYGIVHLRPRELPWQRLQAHEIEVSPQPVDLFAHADGYGNPTSYFHVTSPHTELVVTATSVLDVAAPVVDDATAAVPWEQARPASRPDQPDAWRATEFTFASPLVDLADGAHAYAAESLRPGRPLAQAVDELTHRIYADFTYSSGSTSISTRVVDLLENRRGVCQDFAHFLVACLRSHGLAGRYVSGYLATRPPPGRPRLVGADASHAWAAVWVPGGGWLHLDPTNNRRTSETHATVAWGRDYGDVPPVKGVIFTQGKGSTMKVSVDMASPGT